MKTLIILSLVSLLISACGTKAQRFVKKINEGPTTVTLVKDPTFRSDDFIIVQEGALYYAIDMSYSGSGAYSYYQNNKILVNYVGNGYYSDGSYLYESKESSAKDLEVMASVDEKLKRDHLVEFYSLEFGLSDERAQSMASLTQAWNDVRNNRALTAKDLEVFSKKAFGVSYESIESALSAHNEGTSAPLYNLIEKAADFNEISPEHMSTIVNELMDL